MISQKTLDALTHFKKSEYYSDMSDSLAVSQSRTPGQIEHDRQRQAHQDRLESGFFSFIFACEVAA